MTSKRKRFLFAVTLIVFGTMAGGLAQNVKITPLGTRTGESCVDDRAFLFEDPTGVRILYDPSWTIAGGTDPRLGDVHAIILSHAHADHLGDLKLNQDPNATTARCTTVRGIATTPSPNSNLAEIAAAKNSAVVVGRHVGSSIGAKLQAIRGVATPACPAEVTVPRSAPCISNLDFGGRKNVTRSAGTPGVGIAIVPAHHENQINPVFLSDPLKTQLVDNAVPATLGAAAGYVLSFTNGLRVYLSGDTGITSEMETVVNRFYQPSLIVVNFDDGGTKMGLDEAVFAVKELVKAKAAIPSHMGEVATTAGRVNPGTRTARFIDRLGGIPVSVPRSGITMEFDANGTCLAGCIKAPASSSPNVIGVTFEPSTVQVGGSLTATFSGTNLTAQTFFDIRFRGPGSTNDEVALNWQQGLSARHAVANGTATGTYIVTGIRAHTDKDDHTDEFNPVSGTLTVNP